MTDEAQAEIAGLAADTPLGDGTLREENGRLFLRVGEPAKALAEFEAAVQIDPRQGQWLVEAGQVAYENDDYLKAETYFSRAERVSPSNEIRSSLVMVRDVLGNDPFLPGLSDEEQARRSWRDFQQGLDRLRKCSGTTRNNSAASQPSSELQTLSTEAQTLQKRVNLASLGKDPEMRNEAMQFVYRIEDTASRACGSPAGLDEALALIEKRREGNNP
jgi:tetratricopeptide (TPR) repeat protein